MELSTQASHCDTFLLQQSQDHPRSGCGAGRVAEGGRILPGYPPPHDSGSSSPLPSPPLCL